jgi:hypothetical protein
MERLTWVIPSNREYCHEEVAWKVISMEDFLATLYPIWLTSDHVVGYFLHLS